MVERWLNQRLVESIQQGRLLDFLPRLVVVACDWLVRRYETEFDKYGDSYAISLKADEYLNHLKYMKVEDLRNKKEDIEEYNGLLGLKEKEFK